MAIIDRPKCDQEIAFDISVCPHCGCDQLGEKYQPETRAQFLENARKIYKRKTAYSLHSTLTATKKQSAPAQSEAPTMDNAIKCRICGSTQVTANQKGFGLGKAAVGGFLLGPVGLPGGLFGSKKVTVTRLKCGHSWTPGG